MPFRKRLSWFDVVLIGTLILLIALILYNSIPAKSQSTTIGTTGLIITNSSASPAVGANYIKIGTSDNFSWAKAASGATIGGYASCPPAAPTSPTDPCYNWTAFDTWTSYAFNKGFQVVLTFQHVPQYIASNNTDASCSTPTGFASPNGTCTPPTDINCDGTGTDLTWQNFLTAMFAHMDATWQQTHSKPSVYEGWYQPDQTSSWDNTYINSTRCVGTPNATQKIMKRLNQDLQTKVASFDATAKVSTPAPQNGNTAYASGGWGDTYLAQGGGSFVQALGTNGYTSSGVCAANGGTPSAPTSSHIWIITMENTSAESTDPGATSSTNSSYRRYVHGNATDMPYFNNTLVPQGTYANHMYAVTHSSWPAWIHFVTGNYPCGPTNKSGDCTTSPALGTCYTSSCIHNEQCWNANNLGRQGYAILGNVKSFSEGLCFDGNQTDNTQTGTTNKNCGGYKRGHNPLINFSDMSQGNASGPSTANPPSSFGCAASGHFLDNKTTATASDAAGSEQQLVNYMTSGTSGSLPAGLIYVTPSLGSDMHGNTSGNCCPNLGNGNGGLAAADTWLRTVVTPLLATAPFQPGGDGLLIIDWDEGNILNGGNPLSIATDDKCTSANTGGGCGGHVPFLVIGPNVVAGQIITGNFTETSVGRLVCDALGTLNCPGDNATAPQMPVYVQGTSCPTPESEFGMAGILKAALTRNGLSSSTPLLDTEFGWLSSANMTDANYEKANVARSTLLQWFDGFTMENWFSWDSTSNTSSQLSPNTNAATAYKQVSQWLLGNSPTGSCTCTGPSCGASPPVGVFKCSLTGPASYSAEIAWDSTILPPLSCTNPQCGITNYSAPASATQWRDLLGNTHLGVPNQIGAYPIITETVAATATGACITPKYPFTATNFSIGYNKPGNGSVPSLLPTGSERAFNIFPSADFPSWNNMQTNATSYSTSQIDFWVTFSSTNSQTILWPITQVPTFVSANATDTSCSPTGTCYPPTDWNTGDATLKNFLTKMVSRVGCTGANTIGCVKYFSFINEPNSQNYWKTGATGSDDSNYTTYISMYKDFASTIHGINPNLCTVSGDPQGSSTSTTSGSAGWLNKVLPSLSGNDAAGHPYVDIVAFHPYIGSTGATAYSPTDATHGQDVNLNNIKTVMANAGLSNRPIWATEYAGDSGSANPAMPDNFGATLDQFVAEDQYMLYSGGVVNTFWYEPDVAPINANLSMYTDTSYNTLNSAGNAWLQIRKNLLGTQPNGNCNRVTSTHVECPYVNQATGQNFLAAWDVSGSPGVFTCGAFVQYTTLVGVTIACPAGTNVTLSKSPIWLASPANTTPSGGVAGRANDWPY